MGFVRVGGSCSIDGEFQISDGHFVGSLHFLLESVTGRACLLVIIIPRKFAQIYILELGITVLPVTREIALRYQWDSPKKYVRLEFCKFASATFELDQFHRLTAHA